ncbi:hypothetical protein MJO28_011739 [Puccinia striiformis f. sp. tritici]|uniref:Uncharacterized protein n=1 Tax=Puccinia striiformis f. sp. tritici TaxID=168172 RepID=A0ACC0E4C4_9BASI|nr:hypothetical protein MJO28_011739 [Puccinia striiformis f. sp. tritici]KAI7946977.1 hypothetical protein MJO29_011504 [Puccinia striiformis f. sp. tritici]
MSRVKGKKREERQCLDEVDGGGMIDDEEMMIDDEEMMIDDEEMMIDDVGMMVDGVGAEMR